MKRIEDICAHQGDDYNKFLGAVVPPIFQNSLFVSTEELEKNQDKLYAYTRVSNPTIEVAEVKLAALEKAEAARCFGSGMAAISSAIMHWIKAGSHVVAVDTVYGPANRFLSEYLSRFGVETTFVSGASIREIEEAIQENTDLIYLESPSTYTFVIQDLPAITKLAKEKKIATVIDNTWATPINQNPLEFGIDMVVHSASKYLGGHSDLVAGVIAGRKEDLENLSYGERELFGGILGPQEASLLTRGLRTLPLRMKQHQENAMAVAEFLEGHPKVKRVIYPGLPSFSQYDLGKTLMKGYSSLMSVIIDAQGDRIVAFAKELEYFQCGPSWGGYESLVSPVGAYSDEGSLIPRGLVRLFVGLENQQTLIEDLKQALEKL